MSVSVQEIDFDVSAELGTMRGDNPGIGAVAMFVGLVRDLSLGDEVQTLTLEHYPGMTERSLEEIEAQSRSRWRLSATRIVHRVGTLKPSDQIVLVMAASAHRQDAFLACEFMMDYLKTQAPFWKKEATGLGERWVEARASDATARMRWES